MDIDSSTGGFLTPASVPAPAQDAALDDICQKLVVGITGIPGTLVRPRWQPGNPKQPEPSVDWCAISVTVIKPDAGPAIEHLSAGEGADQVVRHEALDVAATFYGPNAAGLAARLRDGLSVPQNVEFLLPSHFGFVECGDIRAIPEFVNQQWIRRYDMLVRLRRKVARIYPVRNILAADIHLFDDTHVDELITVPPASQIGVT